MPVDGNFKDGSGRREEMIKRQIWRLMSQLTEPDPEIVQAHSRVVDPDKFLADQKRRKKRRDQYHFQNKSRRKTWATIRDYEGKPVKTMRNFPTLPLVLSIFAAPVDGKWRRIAQSECARVEHRKRTLKAVRTRFIRLGFNAKRIELMYEPKGLLFKWIDRGGSKNNGDGHPKRLKRADRKPTVEEKGAWD